jgi:hypothetical protein
VSDAIRICWPLACGAPILFESKSLLNVPLQAVQFYLVRTAPPTGPSVTATAENART